MRKLAGLPMAVIATLVGHLGLSAALAQSSAADVKINPLREAYYGDLHLHTSYSFDAYLSSGNVVGPDEAYRFARGEAVDYLGQPVQRREPLDFLAVTDHSENLGVFTELEDPDSLVSKSAAGREFQAIKSAMLKADTQSPSGNLIGRLMTLWSDFFLGNKNKLTKDLKRRSLEAWTRGIEFANRNYEPGKFTTFIAYEWTAMPFGANLHRNVIFKGDSAPYPFTSIDSKFPEDLWDWLDAIRSQGIEALAIPHNSNASNGLMYDWLKSSNSMSIDQAYAQQRQVNEPLSEIAQIKGTSETHPLLSPNDEFADFEILDVAWWQPSAGQERRQKGSYLRDGLSRGLVLQGRLGVNPYKYGFVGASDAHNGLSVSAQADFGGDHSAVNMGAGKTTKVQASRILADPGALKWNSGKLTGVWAESNTRESIYGSLRRRETFATSGTRLKLRFFGGWNFEEPMLKQKKWIATAYERGVPMGGDLPVKPAAVTKPSFAVWAVKDPNSANLDLVQIIKVWEEDGQQREKVFDVAWSGQRRPETRSGKLPPVGNTVDLKTGQFTNEIGAAELKAIWRDPEFNPHQLAAYYLRVLEIPTARWSTLLALQSDLPLPRDAPPTTQQRAWSSPIWYVPRQAGE